MRKIAASMGSRLLALNDDAAVPGPKAAWEQSAQGLDGGRISSPCRQGAS